MVASFHKSGCERSRTSEPTGLARPNENSLEPVGQTETCRHPKCQPRIGVSHQSTDRRPQRETDTKRCTDHAESAGTLFFGSYVGDVSEGSGNAGSGNPGDDATEKQPPDGWGDCHDHVVETETKTGKEKDRPAAKSIGQNADHR